MNTTHRVIDKRKTSVSLVTNTNRKKNQGALMSEQNRHIRNQRRKLQGCQEKKHDKRKANENKTCSAAIFDLESVLPTPCSLVSQAYYKRKPSCYNLSLHSFGDNKGTCFLWNETEGQRRSCEVTTCLHNYINSLPPNVNHLCFY